MRRTVFRITMFCGLLSGMLFGCGGGDGGNDLLDEGRIRYSVSVMPQNNDEDTQDIDVVQNQCDEEAEEFMDFTTKISIVADKNTADLVVEGYEVTFYPVRGSYMTSYSNVLPLTFADFTPPPDLPHPLNGIRRDYTQTKVMAGGTLELDGILIWPAATKFYYVYNFLVEEVGLSRDICDNCIYDPTLPGYIDINILEAETASFEYDYKIKLYCKDSETNEFTLEAYGTIVLADYNNC